MAGESARLDAQAARGHALSVWLDSDPETLNPLGSPTVWTLRITSDTVFEALVRYRPGESEAQPGGYEPRLARSWRVAPDGREILFELQPDVRFHDGRPFGVADVEFSLEAARQRGARAPLAADLADIASVDAVGGRSVRVRLNRPNAYVLRALAEVPIMPVTAPTRNAPSANPAPGHAAPPAASVNPAPGHAASANPAPGHAAPPAASANPAPAHAAPPVASAIVGTGPYRVRAWQRGTVELERFAGYWGAQPKIAAVTFRFEGDAALALRLARSGEIDLLPALIREHHGEPARAAATAGLLPVHLRQPALRFLALNVRRPPFDDARVRCALVRWIDRKALVTAGRGLTRPAGGPIWPGGPGDGPAMEVPPFDRAGAAALLEQAGWRVADASGLRARGGQRLLLTVLVSDRPDEERDRALEELRAAGVVLDTRVGSTAVLDNRLRDGKFDVAFVEWRALPGEDLTPVYGTGGARNAGGFSDPRVDQALAALRSAWTPAARWAGMGRLGALLAETCPIVPLVSPDPLGLISRRVRGAAVSGGWLSLRTAELASADERR